MELVRQNEVTGCEGEREEIEPLRRVSWVAALRSVAFEIESKPPCAWVALPA